MAPQPAGGLVGASLAGSRLRSLDLSKVGAYGHSTGGGAVFEACWLDERCQAVLGEDPWMVPYDREITETGVQQPALMMYSEAWQNKKNLKKGF